MFRSREEHRERERDLKNKRMALTLTHSIRKGTRVKLNLKYKNSSRSKYYIQLIQKCFPLSLRPVAHHLMQYLFTIGTLGLRQRDSLQGVINMETS